MGQEPKESLWKKIGDFFSAKHIITVASVICGAFAGAFITAYIQVDSYIFIALAVASVIGFFTLITIDCVINKIDSAVRGMTTVRTTCEKCETQCSESAKTLKSINDAENYNDTEVLCLERILTIHSTPDKEEHFCEVSTRHHIRNNSAGVLEKFEYESISDEKIDLANANIQIHLTRSGEGRTKLNARPREYEKKSTEPDEKTRYEYRFINIVNIKNKDTANLELSYKSPAFKDLFTEKRTEFYGTIIRYKTDSFRLVVRLSSNLSKTYDLVLFGESPTAWEIMDFSRNRMHSYEQHIKSTGQDPKLSSEKNQIEWTIQNPKVGFRFVLNFSLDEKPNAGN